MDLFGFTEIQALIEDVLNPFFGTFLLGLLTGFAGFFALLGGIAGLLF